MPTSRIIAAAGAALMLTLPALVPLTGAHPAAAQQGRQGGVVFKSPEVAYKQGLQAWRGGYVEEAISALRFAADHDVFLAKFYLARILADSSTRYTDHNAAYQLYNKLVQDHVNVDPDDDARAAFVAKALTAVAGYLRSGLPEIGVRRDSRRAVEYLRHAAQFFNDEEAQLELAKIYLSGDGVQQDTRAGLHYLSSLSRRGHAGAQAYLADIYWRGRYGVPRDHFQAFALIQLAVESAPESERVWVEDIYQNIFCGLSKGARAQAQGLVADWRQRYGRPAPVNRSSLGALPPQALRTCSNGEAVPPPPASKPISTPSEMRAGTLNMLDVGVTTTNR